MHSVKIVYSEQGVLSYLTTECNVTKCIKTVLTTPLHCWR